ncbi:MAG TPA: ATP-binding cassette domain-containing protein [Jatrophihabitans sp.]|nr:ATP-binding cassette domain-containing protein [Jatrophihabitans sp.]
MPAIEVRRLVKHFGAVRAVDEVSFEVPEASVLGLLGPNGAGKTTVIRMLTTLLRPDSGQVRILGLDVVQQAAQVRRLIGLAGQAAAVDANLTGRENLRLMGRLGQLRRADFRARTEDLLSAFDLVDAASRPARTYSGGMRRRLDVAAALVSRPRVLFLDEPTTGLDLASRTELWALIHSLVEGGTTVVLTTQYLEEADRLADRIAIIDDGRLIANDTPAGLKAALGGTVIDLDWTVDEHATQAAELLGACLGLQARARGSTVTVTARDGSATVIAVLRRLDEHRLAPTGLRVREPSLDDAFLHLTGAGSSAAGTSAGLQVPA